MSSLSLAQARTLIDGALTAARQQGFKPMGVVVVDTAAQVVASVREDGATALRLDIALGTVKVHVQALLDKLNASSRTEAVIEAMRLGVIDLSSRQA